MIQKSKSEKYLSLLFSTEFPFVEVTNVIKNTGKYIYIYFFSFFKTLNGDIHQVSDLVFFALVYIGDHLISVHRAFLFSLFRTAYLNFLTSFLLTDIWLSPHLFFFFFGYKYNATVTSFIHVWFCMFKYTYVCVCVYNCLVKGIVQL